MVKDKQTDRHTHTQNDYRNPVPHVPKVSNYGGTHILHMHACIHTHKGLYIHVHNFIMLHIHTHRYRHMHACIDGIMYAHDAICPGMCSHSKWHSIWYIHA